MATHDVTAGSYPRELAIPHEAGAFFKYSQFARAINELWFFQTPTLVCDVFEVLERMFTSSATEAGAHIYRFPTPYYLGLDWDPKVDIILRRVRTTADPPGTWDCAVDVNGNVTSAIDIPPDGGNQDLLLGTFDLDDTTLIQEVQVNFTTYSNMNLNNDYGRALMIVPARSAPTSIPVATAGSKHNRDLWFLPDGLHGVFSYWPVHLFDLAKTILTDVHKRRFSPIVMSSRFEQPGTDRRMPFVADIPPNVTAATFHVLAHPSTASSGGTFTINFAGQTWTENLPSVTTPVWYTNTFSGLEPGPGRLVFGDASVGGVGKMNSLCGWWDAVA